MLAILVSQLTCMSYKIFLDNIKVSVKEIQTLSLYEPFSKHNFRSGCFTLMSLRENYTKVSVSKIQLNNINLLSLSYLVLLI